MRVHVQGRRASGSVCGHGIQTGAVGGPPDAVHSDLVVEVGTGVLTAAVGREGRVSTFVVGETGSRQCAVRRHGDGPGTQVEPEATVGLQVRHTEPARGLPRARCQSQIHAVRGDREVGRIRNVQRLCRLPGQRAVHDLVRNGVRACPVAHNPGKLIRCSRRAGQHRRPGPTPGILPEFDAPVRTDGPDPTRPRSPVPEPERTPGDRERIGPGAVPGGVPRGLRQPVGADRGDRVGVGERRVEGGPVGGERKPCGTGLTADGGRIRPIEIGHHEGVAARTTTDEDVPVQPVHDHVGEVRERQRSTGTVARRGVRSPDTGPGGRGEPCEHGDGGRERKASAPHGRVPLGSRCAQHAHTSRTVTLRRSPGKQ